MLVGAQSRSGTAAELFGQGGYRNSGGWQVVADRNLGQALSGL